MQTRPSLRELFPSMFFSPAARRDVGEMAVGQASEIALPPLKDAEYRRRLVEASWKGGIPIEFIDPVFNTIIDNEKFQLWLSYVEANQSTRAEIAVWQNPSEVSRVNMSLFKAEYFLLEQLIINGQNDVLAFALTLWLRNHLNKREEVTAGETASTVIVPVAMIQDHSAAKQEAEFDNDSVLLAGEQMSYLALNNLQSSAASFCSHENNDCNCSHSSSHGFSSSQLSFLSNRDPFSRSISNDNSLDFDIADSAEFADTNALLKF